MGNVNKIIYGGQTLIDLTSDTVTTDKMLSGTTAHDKTGAIITGTCTYDADTSDATTSADEVLLDQVFYANGNKLVGTMPNNGRVSISVANFYTNYTIPRGYHDGSGTVALDSTEVAKLVSSNIRQGVVLFGVPGTMSGTEGAKAQSKEVTPSSVAQTIIPDSEDGYNYLSQVTVNPIPYSESTNSYGITVTIG